MAQYIALVQGYMAFGIGMQGYIGLVDGAPYSLFIAPGLISMTAVNAR